MEIHLDQIAFKTRSGTDIVDITESVAAKITQYGVSRGSVLIFVPGATAALTTIEYEPGLVSDLKDLFEFIAPEAKIYRHNERWGDGNGHAHIRASLLGPSLTIPISAGRMTLGTWQQIVFVDFDNVDRERRVVVQISGISD